MATTSITTAWTSRTDSLPNSYDRQLTSTHQSTTLSPVRHQSGIHHHLRRYLFRTTRLDSANLIATSHDMSSSTQASTCLNLLAVPKQERRVLGASFTSCLYPQYKTVIALLQQVPNCSKLVQDADGVRSSKYIKLISVWHSSRMFNLYDIKYDRTHVDLRCRSVQDR